MRLLSVEKLEARHGQLQAVRGVSLGIERGETVALVGANGAGKTTLLRTIAGAHPIAAGRVVFKGEDISSRSPHARAALDPPETLGEARHPLANCADLLLMLGDARAAAGDDAGARRAWMEAATAEGDFQGMSTRPYSEMTYFSVLAWRRLGRADRAERLAEGLTGYAAELRRTPARVDYFATSLPTMLLFTDDVQARREVTAAFLAAQAAAALGRWDEARAGISEVLARDPNHLPAIVFRDGMRTAAREPMA